MLVKQCINRTVYRSSYTISKLKEECRIKLKEWIETKLTSTLKELVLRCASELKIKIGQSSRKLKKLRFSHITRRKSTIPLRLQQLK